MRRQIIFGACITMLAAGAWVAAPARRTDSDPNGGVVRSLIVQGRDLATVAEAVRGVGGEITHELGIIDAVAARLTRAQRARLADSGVRAPDLRRIVR